jgi:general secretion pathway protein A
MTEDYIAYWGLTSHPFLLAPDSKMMSITGQYYECLERLRYAINTNKGGVLIISEDAGLGKTTILNKLIEQMKDEYGGAFKYAFIDHPTLTADQIIFKITASISDQTPGDDKLKNLSLLRDALIEVRERGGKSIIIVDEGQMLCEAKEVLQELRVLINLTHNNEYLHTFILSGQKALWETIKEMPEFWQRLPVRYYFVPLQLDETKDLVTYRLAQSGAEDGREIFADDAMEIIHKYSRGSARTIIALADLCLLVGCTNHVSRITFKEVSKAINAMSGKGETLPYMLEEKKKTAEPSLGSITDLRKEAPVGLFTVKRKASERRDTMGDSKDEPYARPFFLFLAIVLLILVGGIGYQYIFADRKENSQATIRKTLPVIQAEKAIEPPSPVKESQDPAQAKPEEKVVSQKGPEVKVAAIARPEEKPAAPAKPVEKVSSREGSDEKTVLPSKGAEKATEKTRSEKQVRPTREATVSKDAANVRVAPNIKADRIGMIFNGQRIAILGERSDREGLKWYKVLLYGDRQGWIADSTVAVAPAKR